MMLYKTVSVVSDATMYAVWLCVCFLAGVVAQLEAPAAVIAQGELRGKYFTTRNGRTVSGFLGIPFAQPPIWNLRFRSPVAADGWAGVRNATADGPPCVQINLLDFRNRNASYGSEDCLYLNVFTPEVSTTAKLPVMVYFHGGGFFSGSSSSDFYGPDFLLDKDVVLVVSNYRLGPLGFLSTEDKHLPGNYGLKDQTEALRWVYCNIHAFGGNRDSVTIFGNSAGAGSVHLHMMSPLSKGLFHAGISESGSGLCQWATHPPGTYKMIAFRVAKDVGCPTDDPQYLADCLRRISAEAITSVLAKYLDFDLDPLVLFPPIVESYPYGAFLTQDPWTKTTSVPWMAGVMSHEGFLRAGSLISGANAKAKVAKLNTDYQRLLPASIMVDLTSEDPVSIADRVKNFYFGKDDISLSVIPRIIDMYSDSWFTYCTVEAVARHKGPVYQYYFSYKGSHTIAGFLGDKMKSLGTIHGDELIYLFPLKGFVPNRVDTKEDAEFSKNLVELWTNFARYRNPTPSSNTFTRWDPVTTNEKEYLHLKTDGYSMESNLLKERMDFWKELPFRAKPKPTN